MPVLSSLNIDDNERNNTMERVYTLTAQYMRTIVIQRFFRYT